METAVFRIGQECLTNILAYSGSAIAKGRVSRSDTDLRVEVQNQGKGISPAKRFEMEQAGKAGVGIKGMRERIRQLGGGLQIGPQHVAEERPSLRACRLRGVPWSRLSKERQYRRYGWMSRHAIVETRCSPSRQSGATRFG